jgi:hypothetical protein
MTPAVIAFSLYPFALLLAAGFAAYRGVDVLVIAAAGVVLIWLLGIIAQLSFVDRHLPVTAYLAMDAIAFSWLRSREKFWPSVFAATFALQIAIHLLEFSEQFARPIDYWWAHTASAYLQLAVLVVWAIKCPASDPQDRESCE